MNSDIKYYKYILPYNGRHDGSWPLLSIQHKNDVIIVGYYEIRTNWNQNINIDRATGWVYIKHSLRDHTGMESRLSKYIEITKEEADKEIFLYEL